MERMIDLSFSSLLSVVHVYEYNRCVVLGPFAPVVPLFKILVYR